MQGKRFSGNSGYHILAAATNIPTSSCYLAEMLACRLAWESKGIAKSVTLWAPRLAWGRQGRVNHDYNRLVIAFRPKQEPWALSVTNCVVINLIIQGNMGKEGLPAPGVTGRRPGPLPKGPASGGRLPVCSLYPGLAGRNRKRCCEGDPVSWACLTWMGIEGEESGRTGCS